MARRVGGTGILDGLPVEELFRQEHDRLLRLCVAILGNHHDAEEAVQETFLRVYLRLDSLEGDPRAYFTVVARRICWNLRRRAVPTEPVEAVEAGAADPTAELLDRQVMAGVWSRLTAGDRRLIFGSYAGYSYDELAETAGTTAKTISVALVRARRRARKLLEGLTLLPPSLRLLWLRLTGRRDAEPAHRGLPLLLATATAAVGCLLSCLNAVTPSVHAAPGGPQAPIARVLAGGRIAAGPVSPRPAPAATTTASPSRSTAASGSPGSVARLLLPPPRGTSAGALDQLGKHYYDPGAQQPEGQDIQNLSFSPDYRHDHIVFATGTSGTDCVANTPVPACYTVMYMTRDGGASWMPGYGMNSFNSGGAVLFPGGDRLDPQDFAVSGDGAIDQPLWTIPVFTAGSRGLAMLRGNGWRLVTPITGPTVIDPSSPADDIQLLIGASTLMRVLLNPDIGFWQYQQPAPGRVEPEPGPVLIPGGADSMLFTPATDHLLIAYHLGAAPPAGTIAIVETCAAGACRPLLDRPGSGPLTLEGASTGPGQGLVLAWSDTQIWIADAGTLVFRPVPLPAGGLVTGAALSTDGTRLTVAMHLSPPLPVDVPRVPYPSPLPESLIPPDPIMVARSDDLGRSWSTAISSGAATSSGPGIRTLSDLMYLPDGNMLAVATGADPTFTDGLICSPDGGLAWGPRC